MKPRRTKEADRACCCFLEIQGCCCSTSRSSSQRVMRERLKDAPAAFAALCIVASHRHQYESGGRCSPPTSTIILVAPQTQNSIFFLLNAELTCLHRYVLADVLEEASVLSTLDNCMRLLIRSALMVCLTSSSWPRPRCQTPSRHKGASFRGPLTPRGFRKVHDN